MLHFTFCLCAVVSVVGQKHDIDSLARQMLSVPFGSAANGAVVAVVRGLAGQRLRGRGGWAGAIPNVLHETWQSHAGGVGKVPSVAHELPLQRMQQI